MVSFLSCSARFLKKILPALVLFFSCSQNPIPESNSRFVTNDEKTEIGINDLTDTLLCDGFDYPVGDCGGNGKYKSITDGKTYSCWKISTKFTEKYDLGIHPGIDLNGSGGGNTDLGQPVFSIGNGIVIDAKDYGKPWGNVILIKHEYLENGHFRVCFSLYAHLDRILIKDGCRVRKRMLIGTVGTGGGSYPAHLHLEIRKSGMENFETTFWPGSHSKGKSWIEENYVDPYQFIKSHRKLCCPLLEERIIIAIKNKYKLYYFIKGKLQNEYEIALSQNPVGHKQKQGDNKMPEGEYYICEKQKGPFYGNYAEFLGTRIIRISYPNSIDAKEGWAKGLISKSEMENIISSNRKQEIPPKNTKLGGGIVIHGWAGEWIADGKQNLTWGCISMHKSDLESFFDQVALKTKIIIIQ